MPRTPRDHLLLKTTFKKWKVIIFQNCAGMWFLGRKVRDRARSNHTTPDPFSVSAHTCLLAEWRDLKQGTVENWKRFCYFWKLEVVQLVNRFWVVSLPFYISQKKTVSQKKKYFLYFCRCFLVRWEVDKSNEFANATVLTPSQHFWEGNAGAVFEKGQSLPSHAEEEMAASCFNFCFGISWVILWKKSSWGLVLLWEDKKPSQQQNASSTNLTRRFEMMLSILKSGFSVFSGCLDG